MTRSVCCAAQVRDEYRIDYDQGRGGYGKVVQQELAFQGMQGLQQVGGRGSWLPACCCVHCSWGDGVMDCRGDGSWPAAGRGRLETLGSC